jgi:hypothetical protein
MVERPPRGPIERAVPISASGHGPRRNRGRAAPSEGRSRPLLDREPDPNGRQSKPSARRPSPSSRQSRQTLGRELPRRLPPAGEAEPDPRRHRPVGPGAAEEGLAHKRCESRIRQRVAMRRSPSTYQSEMMFSFSFVLTPDHPVLFKPVLSHPHQFRLACGRAFEARPNAQVFVGTEGSFSAGAGCASLLWRSP